MRPVVTALASLSLCLAVACDSADRPPASTDGSGDAPVCEAGPVPARSPGRLLTRVEYDATVAALLKTDQRPGEGFPPEAELFGFENNADQHRPEEWLVEQYLRAAESLAAETVEQRLEAVVGCDPSAVSACAPALLDGFVRRAFRRDLEAAERGAFQGLFDTALERYDGPTAVRLVIEATLQSPQFLYRLELAGAEGAGGAVMLTDNELAARLSYFLWNGPPDDALEAAASAGELSTEAGLETQARRLLDDDRARAMVADFHRQWLGLDRFLLVSRDDLDGTQVDLGASWRRSLEQYLEYAFWDAGTVKDLFTSPRLFLDEDLAVLHGLTDTGTLDGMGTEPRAGLLTQPGLLAMLALPDQSSPIQRGVFIREQLLCEPLGTPPPSVDQTPPSTLEAGTTREKFAAHTEIPACQGCHAKIDGLGFGLESFDQLGRFRTTDNGLPVDDSGDVFEPDTEALAGPYQGAVELAERLGGSRQVQDCLATQWYRYALGRAEETDDLCSLDQVQARFDASGGNFRDLLVAIVLSDAFRYRKPYAQETP